jgi:hypothetical protein
MACKEIGMDITYVKAPIANTPTSTTLFFIGSRTRNNRGIGMLNMIRSDEMFKTAFVIRWFVAALHCASSVNHCFQNGPCGPYQRALVGLASTVRMACTIQQSKAPP